MRFWSSFFVSETVIKIWGYFHDKGFLVIESATLIAYPVAKEGGKSMAAEIASKWIPKNKRHMPLLFPMILDKDDLQIAINLLKKQEDDLDIALQFENYR